MGAVVTRTRFVELASLNLCVGVALSGSAVGLSRFFVRAAQRKMLCCARAVGRFVSRRA